VVDNIEEGLRVYVDGDHFFDLLAEDVVFDFVIELYRGYGATFSLDRCYAPRPRRPRGTPL